MDQCAVFTICPQYGKGYKENLLKEKYNLTGSNMRNFINYPRNEDSKHFFEKVTYDLSELVKSVKITTNDESPEFNSRYITLDVNSDGLVLSNGVKYEHEQFFRNVNWLTFGRCYTFQITTDFKELSVSRIYLLHIYFFN